jgi:hypothetical protein
MFPQNGSVWVETTGIFFKKYFTQGKTGLRIIPLAGFIRLFQISECTKSNDDMKHRLILIFSAGYRLLLHPKKIYCISLEVNSY